MISVLGAKHRRNRYFSTYRALTTISFMKFKTPLLDTQGLIALTVFLAYLAFGIQALIS